MDKKHRPVVIWLITGAILVAAMVVIGGITRLTQSGLSMVEWNLIMGSIPPIGEVEWQAVFDKYKQSPQYQIVNYDFKLEDFKSIFWWEYIHRLLGRLIGLVFVIPFIVFVFQKRINRSLLKKLIVLFIMGAFQGFLGWYMVKSGLVKDPHVSHYRLAIHLIAALTLYCYILWVAMDLSFSNKNNEGIKGKLAKLNTYAIVGIFLLGIQIMYGAFVAGLKAGLYYNTWPKMGTSWIPAEVGDSFGREGLVSLIDNITMVQFIHRTLAWLVAILVFGLIWKVRKINISTNLALAIYGLGVLVLLQIALGIGTLVMHIPVEWGVFHQFGALLLLTNFIIIIHRSRSSKSF